MNLIIQLSGGLGNQLFQYATSRAICERSQAALCIDPISGFVRDRKFRRTYELDNFPIRSRPASWRERKIGVLDASARHILGAKSPINHFPWGDSLRETKAELIPEISNFRITRPTRIKGYWQSPKYFESLEKVIRTELKPPIPRDHHFLELGRIMRQANSVAIGCRLYEEAQNPARNARNGRTKSITELAEAAHAILENNPETRAFVFCTHRSSLLDKLRMPPHTVFITEEEGYRGAANNLWLLTQCRNHVFNNSTFYWWGAWLSETWYKHNPGTIIAADNFINIDSIPPRWLTF